MFTSISSDTASLSWTLGAGTDIPEMLISTDSAFALLTPATGVLGQNTTIYYGLFANATYYFKVGVSGVFATPVSSATNPQTPYSSGWTNLSITSASISWAAANNFTGTQYFAELATDEGYSISQSTTTVPGASGFTFTGLNADTTYYARVLALGVAGRDSEFLNYASTVTRANPPTGGGYGVVYSTGLTATWGANGNFSWTNYTLQLSSSPAFAFISVSTFAPGVSYTASGLIPNTSYYARAWAVNGAGLATAQYTFPASTVTYAAMPAAPGGTALTPNSGQNSVTVIWDINGNPVDTQFYVQASTAADFSGTNWISGEWATYAPRTATGLTSGREYYFRVKARNRLGRETAYFYLGQATGPSGEDITPPAILDLQSGDDQWRGAASGFYSVYFNDGTKVDGFQVSVTSGPGFTGTVISTWTDVVTNINAEEYSIAWQLPPASFSAITENVKSYVSVRAFDQAANTSTVADVFYVWRDTTAPVITDSANSPAGWWNTDPGVFNVDFADALSGLSRVQYSASSLVNSGNGNVVDWRDIDAFASSPTYTADWGVDFAALANGASNYISVRAVDNAGNSFTVKDVFRILKNTVGPNVTITSPAGALVSTITAFSGTATQMNEISPVASAEISLRELTSVNSYYYNGGTFSSGTEAWLPAAGQAAWSFNASTVPLTAGTTQYQLRARARDINGLVTAANLYASRTFQLFSAVPTVTLSTPVAGSSVAVFGEAAGTAADGGGAGLGPVEVYVKRLFDGRWWNFETSEWGETRIASATVAAANWHFTPGALLRGNLAHNQQYFITARALDASVPPNMSDFAVPGATFTCIDSMAPQQVTQLAASTGTSPGRINLAWTFPGDDGGALPIPSGSYAVGYATFPAAAYSTQAAQVLFSTGAVLPGAAQRYTVSGLTPNGTYYLKLWLADDAGLWSPASPQVTTMAGESLNDEISGTVKTPGGTGITGVVVEAYANTGVLAATAYSLDDGLGSFTLPHLADGLYRVQATWVDGGFETSIAKDQMPMGYADVNFVLAVAFQLAGVAGTIPQSVPSGFRPAAAGGGTVQLWQGGRKVCSVQADASGRFAIRNLLPGRYTLKVMDAGGAWKSFEVKLESGQTLQISPLGTLLNKSAVYAYPNPAAAKVTFHAESEVSPVTVQISVFSVDGTLVKTIEKSFPGPGPVVCDEPWNFSGGKPASGVYFYTIRVKQDHTGKVEKLTRKFAVVR